MAQLSAFQRWLRLKKYHFELSVGIYMMQPGEKLAIYSIFFLLFSLTFIAVVLYLPHHISFLVGRAWYYINGEHIDVGVKVKEMSASVLEETAATGMETAGMGAGAGATVVEAVKDAAEAATREL